MCVSVCECESVIHVTRTSCSLACLLARLGGYLAFSSSSVFFLVLYFVGERRRASDAQATAKHLGRRCEIPRGHDQQQPPATISPDPCFLHTYLKFRTVSTRKGRDATTILLETNNETKSYEQINWKN